MRLIGAILLILVTFGLRADHLLGGEITYVHLSEMKYQVNVTLFRDCNGSKLGGTGGGSSTSNHSDLSSAYLRLSENSNCSGSGSNLAVIPLSKLGYEEITDVCDNVATACATNPDVNYGIEAHKYRGTIDLSAYSSYQGCAFEIYFSISDRSDDLTTTTSGQTLYNYTYLDPWSTNDHSPKFVHEPRLIFEQNKAAYLNYGIEERSSDDSVSYSFGTPMTSSSSLVTYKDGFSATEFLTAFCPSGNCSPDPDAVTPKGIDLSTSGNITFTPTKLGEYASMVLEVEVWKKRNGKAYLFSKVRRDVVYSIILKQDFYTPRINALEVYEYCVGEKIDIGLTTSRFFNPGDVIPSNDSIYLHVDAPNGFKDSSVFPSNSSYQQVYLKADATEDLVGTHQIYVQAIDNHCPIPGRSQRVITINVRPKPQFSVEVKEIFCGHTEIKVTGDQYPYHVLVNNGSRKLLDKNSKGTTVFNYDRKAILDYSITMNSEFGCSSKQAVTKTHGGKDAVVKARISGDLEACSGDTFDLKIEHDQYTIGSVNWWVQQQLESGTDHLKTLRSGDIMLMYELEHMGYTCHLRLDTSSSSIALPEVGYSALEDQCVRGPAIELSQLNPNPVSGTWSSETVEIEEGWLRVDLLENYGASYDLVYEYTDPETGCFNSIKNHFNLLPAPELRIKDVAMCGTNFKFRLSNAIELPMHYSPENITWTVTGYDQHLSGEHPLTDLDVPSMGVGEYEIIGLNTYSNGCFVKDTALLKVDKSLQLTYNGLEVICQSDELIDLEKLLEVNVRGGGWHIDKNLDNLNGAIFNPKDCGHYQLTYTYDGFGCYDQITIPLIVECKPDIELNVIEDVCVNSNAQMLLANLDGVWSGAGVTASRFYPNIGEGVHQIKFVHTTENSCVYSETTQVKVVSPVYLNVSDIPAQLCEGEDLELQISKDDHSTLTVEVCNEFGLSMNSGVLNYQPSQCDLQKQSIMMHLSAESFAGCPIVVQDLEVPYYPRPEIEPLEPIAECYPFTVKQVIETSKGISPELSYTITSSSTTFEQSGTQIDYDFPSSGVYDLRVQLVDVSGCVNEVLFDDLYLINHKPQADFSLNSDHLISISQDVIEIENETTVEEGDLDYNWYLEKDNIITYFSSDVDPYLPTPADTGKYAIVLEATTNFGCADTAKHHIELIPEVLIFIPNAFSPDGKGPIENEEFKVVASNVKEFRMEIYNRWGQRVFVSLDPNEGWDGTYLGKECVSGTYFYSIVLVNGSDKPFAYEGTFNLLK